MNVNGLIGTSGLSTSHAADSLTAPLSTMDSDCGESSSISVFGGKKKKIKKQNTKQNYPVLKVPGTFLW